jgi:hypothetical protein
MTAPLWFLLFAVGQVAFVFGAGVASLFIYRRGHAALWVQNAARTTGPAALVFDLLLAARLTYCGCLTHAAVRGLPERRALRFLWWASAFRATTLFVLLLSGMLLPTLLILTIAGALAPRFIGEGSLSPAAVFVNRAPRGRSTLREVVVDAAKETAEMWRAYGLILLPIAAVASAWAGSLTFISGVVAAHLAAIAGRFARVDLVAALPLVVAAKMCGFGPEVLVTFAVSCEIHSVRTRRLFTSYLREESATAYVSFNLNVSLLLALALGLLAKS